MTGRLRRFAGDAVGGADHLAGTHAAAREQGGVHLRPMVAADLVADPRRAAELAHDDDAAIVGEAAPVQVFDQGADAVVEDRGSLPVAQKIGCSPGPRRSCRRANPTCCS